MNVRMCVVWLWCVQACHRMINGTWLSHETTQQKFTIQLLPQPLMSVMKSCSKM